ncbi:MAG TPA: flavodoxin domain-containing protein [Terriglobales bacterium]|nr:flavodoxin domain-containing protein [Terriglobales bacterium]
MKVLIAYASGHGSTGEVAQFIADVLKEHDIDVTVQLADQIQSLSGYDAFVVGSPIYGGMWLTEVSQFLEKFKAELSAKPTHLWIMCIRVLESDGLEHALKEYVHQTTLNEIGIHDVGVFAGKLDLSTIDWNERWTLAARYDGDALPGTRNDDYRDWDAIRTWAKNIREELMPT